MAEQAGITIRLDKDKREAFKRKCKDQGYTYTNVLRNFIYKTIAEK